MPGVLRRGIAAVAATGLTVVAGAALAAPAAAVAASYPDAVVLVSGYNSSTAFTTPDPGCEGKEGDTWSIPTGPDAALRKAGLEVFTAPVRHGSDPIVPPCAPGGAPTPSASMYIDSFGDDDANGVALASFLEFLHDSYGLQRIQLVAHSDGGMWSRAALTDDAQFEGLDVRSLTTLGTPYTGSMIADLGTELKNGKCDASNRIEQDVCEALLDVIQLVYSQLGPTAIAQLTHSYLEGWNPKQRIGACPVTTIAGTRVDLPLLPFSFYNPSDGLVGEASAEAHEALSLPSLRPIPAPEIPGLKNGGTYPVVHAPSLGFISTANLLNTQAIADEVTDTVEATPDGPLCNASAPEAVGGESSGSVKHVAPFRLAEGPSKHGVLGKASPDAIAVAGRGVALRCGGSRLETVPLFGDDRVNVGLPGRCSGKVRAHTDRKTRPAALLLHARASSRLTVVHRGRSVKVKARGGRLKGLRVSVRADGERTRLKLDRKGRAKLPRGDEAATLLARARTGAHPRVAAASLVLSR